MSLLDTDQLEQQLPAFGLTTPERIGQAEAN